jgi:uncharacterized protein (DUF4415 family)
MMKSDLYPLASQIELRSGLMKKDYDFGNAKRGAVVPQRGKTRITIYLDDEVLEEFRERADEAGCGYQTMINEALRVYLLKSTKPLDEDSLRKILREELQSVC